MIKYKDFILLEYLTPEQISKALDDENHFVRKMAIIQPNATPEHISKALNDTDADVRKAAINRLDFQK